jgi:hypothetical protein
MRRLVYAILLLMLVVSGAIWVRSYSAEDMVGWTDGNLKAIGVDAACGELRVFYNEQSQENTLGVRWNGFFHHSNPPGPFIRGYPVLTHHNLLKEGVSAPPNLLEEGGSAQREPTPYLNALRGKAGFNQAMFGGNAAQANPLGPRRNILSDPGGISTTGPVGSFAGPLAVPFGTKWQVAGLAYQRGMARRGLYCRQLIFPCWYLGGLGIAVLPAYWGQLYWKRRRQMRRLRNGCCPQCGYDMRATKERCPECGTAVPGLTAVGTRDGESERSGGAAD